ncbi:MAG: sulfotransferase domain-containing protein [Candidatus Binatia bacterium]
MTRTIWLASYPKSGNTWLRALLGNVLADDEPTGINGLLCGNASERRRFDVVVLIDSGLLTDDEVDCLRPSAYRAIADGDYDDCLLTRETLKSVRFIKAHDAYLKTSAGGPLLGGSQGAWGAIVLVRDPRDVAVSFAHHLGESIDEVVAIMSDDDKASTFLTKSTSQELQFRQKLLSWSSHAASWLDQTDIPAHLIRYEDMLNDTGGALSDALVFAGVAVSADKINRAVASCGFESLREQEWRNGFAEAPRRGTRFFRRGETGAWRYDLTREQVVRIESCHAVMMHRLGYKLSYASDLARAG